MAINFWIFFIGSVLRLIGFDFEQIGEIILAIAGWIG
jgi:uncharacterized protein YybS (DUF2232 family)